MKPIVNLPEQGEPAYGIQENGGVTIFPVREAEGMVQYKQTRKPFTRPGVTISVERMK